jgi:hypothetical protein
MQIVSKAHSYVRPAAGILTAVIGITTTLNVATAKFLAPGQTNTWTTKSYIILSRIIGPQSTSQIVLAMNPASGGNPGVGLPPAGIAPFGPFNSTTFAGVGILIINAVIKHFSVPYYNTWAAPFINALGVGTVVGGVVGGLLDPDPSQMTQTGGPPFLSYNPILPLQPPAASTQALQPFKSVQAVRLHGR